MIKYIYEYYFLKDGVIMADPNTAYFFRKFYRNIIKWWFVVYNPIARKIWPSKKEEEAARKEEEELENTTEDFPADFESDASYNENFNVTTGAPSGEYGKQPIDTETQAALDVIMLNSNISQSHIDSLVHESEVTLSQEQEQIIAEANRIYERLKREAAEDEARKLAEIENVKKHLIQ